MSESKIEGDRKAKAFKVLERASQAYATIQETINQFKRGDLDYKLQLLLNQNDVLVNAANYFADQTNALLAATEGGRSYVVEFEIKLVEGISEMMEALVKETSSSIEKAVKLTIDRKTQKMTDDYW